MHYVVICTMLGYALCCDMHYVVIYSTIIPHLFDTVHESTTTPASTSTNRRTAALGSADKLSNIFTADLLDKDEWGDEDEADVRTSRKPALGFRATKGESTSAVALWPPSVVSAREKLAVRPPAGSSTSIDRFPTIITSSASANAIPSVLHHEENITCLMKLETTKDSPSYSNPNPFFTSELFPSKSHKRKSAASYVRRKAKLKDVNVIEDLINRSDDDTSSSSSSLNSLGGEEEHLRDTSKRIRIANITDSKKMNDVNE